MPPPSSFEKRGPRLAAPAPLFLPATAVAGPRHAVVIVPRLSRFPGADSASHELPPSGHCTGDCSDDPRRETRAETDCSEALPPPRDVSTRDVDANSVRASGVGVGVGGRESFAKRQQRLQQQQQQRRVDEHALGSSSSSSTAKRPWKTKSRARTPPVLDPLDGMKMKLRRTLLQHASLADAVESRIDRASRVVPIQFLREHQRQHAFAQRVVLLTMTRVLQGHYLRVKRVAWNEWKKVTLTRRVLEDHERKLFIMRQSSLAHACAIIQRSILARMHVLWTRWVRVTELMRFIEHTRSARRIQKCWRAWNTLHKLKTVVLTYRDRVRDASAVVIQSTIRRFLARCEMARVVWLHKRHTAVSRIQKMYRNYVLRRIALRHRQVLAAIFIQRVWRGYVARACVRDRKVACRVAAEQLLAQHLWEGHGIEIIVWKYKCASQIQRCIRVFLYRQSVCRGLRAAKHRRRMVPAYCIQKMWRLYHAAQIYVTLDTMVFRVVMTHVSAVRRIQHCFRRYWQKKLNKASRIITKLLRSFQAKRVMMCNGILQWLFAWRGHALNKWSVACSGTGSQWRKTLHFWQDRLDQFAQDQASPRRRLNVVKGLQLILQCKLFDLSFRAARVEGIQRTWRWHRLCVLIAQLRRAVIVLRRAIPLRFRQYKMRLHRQRVLHRWKRQRHIVLRGCFDYWKRQHLLCLQARDLSTSTRKLRKALWFHHHKLRKRMVQQWWNYILHRRHKHRKLLAAISLDKHTKQHQFLHAWRKEALPALCCANRLREIGMTLIVWNTWTAFVCRKRKSRKARVHRERVLKGNSLVAWRHDRANYLEELRHADSFRAMQTTKYAFSALTQYVAKMNRVRAFCLEKHQRYAVRRWLERLYGTKRHEENKRLAMLLRKNQLQRTMWRHWNQHVTHQAKQRVMLAKTEQIYQQRRLRALLRVWSRELVPMWKDCRLIEETAMLYRARRLKEVYFRKGVAKFWALTAGARRIEIAIRIQRTFRGKRARHRVFVLRMKIQYQLETRFSTGVDVQRFTANSLEDALTSHEWVFVLFSFPWAPVGTRVNEAFYKTATAWTFLKNQASRMAFGLADASEMMSGPMSKFSMMSWFGLLPAQLPCVVGFWHGIGPPVTGEAEPTSRLMNGKVCLLKRRFKTVCTSSLIYKWPTPHHPGDQPPPPSMSQLVAWVERLQSVALEASVIDVQSFVRGYLVRRHTKRRRVLEKQRQVQRIRAWIRAVVDKSYHHKRDHFASRIQRWIRQIWARRAFWKSFQQAMVAAKQAVSRLQRAVRAQLFRRRLRVALISLLATCELYPNAPLCQECFHVGHTLARLQCRDCQQAYCVKCFDRTHKTGKRLLHLCNSIDIVAMNGESSRMCSRCEVRGIHRFCKTCIRDKDSLCGEWTCMECFEFRHTEERGSGRHLKRVPWWNSRPFQTHEWKRVGCMSDADVSASLNASTVMDKYGWQSKHGILRKLKETVELEVSLRDREEKLLAIRLQNEAILRDAFDRFDTDKSGAIDRAEFKRMFKEELCEPMTDQQVDEAMKFMDKSDNGLIEFDELLAWFAEEALAKEKMNAGDPRSLLMLKEALKAKRQMRRYKEKLHEFVPSVSLNVADQPKRVLAQAMAQLADKRRKKKTVPGFPSVECLEHGDFARKKNVFNRFMHEICGLEWIYEDEKTIPVTNAMDVFDQVFVPRWNAGELTYDFYFDEESFEFEGEAWQRRWEPSTKRYVFTTTRRKMRTVIETSSGDRKSSLRRKSCRRSTKSASDSSAKTIEIEETVEIVEAIDPRRKQMLLENAQAAFQKADVDGSGFIDETEFHRMLTLELCEPVSKAKARQIMKQLDADSSGKIDFNEFFQWYAADKCQDYPLTAQMERAKALLKTRRRAKDTVSNAVHVSMSTGRQLKDAIAHKRKERQLVKDCKGAPPELIVLLQEGHEKLLAEKALTLHNHDVAFARRWLENKQRGEREEREEIAREKAERAAQAEKAKRLKQQQRRQKMKATRKFLKNLLIGPSKKEAHAARVEQALSNLDREILMVEKKLHGQDDD